LAQNSNIRSQNCRSFRQQLIWIKYLMVIESEAWPSPTRRWWSRRRWSGRTPTGCKLASVATLPNFRTNRIWKHRCIEYWSRTYKS
jgi:hypothetical protein